MCSKAIKLALSILLFGNPTLAQQRVEKIDVLEGQKTYKNYAKNPSAIKNTNGTSVSSATIARDTDAADKLDGIASFNCDASALNGYCKWDISTINEGDKTGNCEVSATFKGDASLYSLRLTDGTNVLYDLPLKNQADWGGASFNYPCGATRDVRLVQTTAGTAPAANIGRIYYGPATNLVNASVVTDWVSYTPTVTSYSGGATNYTVSGSYKRVGDSIIIQGKIVFSSAPAAFTGLLISLPSGLTRDASKTGAYTSLGNFFSWDAGNNSFPGNIYSESVSSVSLVPAGVATHTGTAPVLNPSLSNTFPFSFNTSDSITWISELIPILGWSSSSMAIAPDEALDLIGSVLVVAGSCPTNTLEANGATVSRATYSRLFQKIGTAHGTGDGSTTFHLPDYRGRFLRGADGGTGRDPSAGSRTAMNSGGATGNNIGSIQDDAFQAHKHEYSNIAGPHTWGTGSPSVSGFYGAGSGTNVPSLSNYPYYDGGSYSPRTSSESRPKNANVRFCVVFKGTNAPILVDQNEMSVSYKHDAGQSLTSTGIIKFNLKIKDDFETYNTTTGVFTAPFAGTYEVSYTLFSASATTSWDVFLRKNSTQLARTRPFPTYSGGTSIVTNQSTSSLTPYIVYLSKGDTLDIYLGFAASAGALYTNAQDNWLTIKRVGN